MLRHEYIGFWVYLAILAGLPLLYSPESFARDLSGEVDVSNMPNSESIKTHIDCIKIIIISSAGEQTKEIDVKTRSFRAQNIGNATNLNISWIWKTNCGVCCDCITHGLIPIIVNDVSGKVMFTFYDLGSIHVRFVKEVIKSIEKKTFTEAKCKIDLANDFYDMIRNLNCKNLASQANSWNYTLYQDGFDTALRVGVRSIDREGKVIIRDWLKKSISLCVEHESLRSRLGGALQSWSKFSKLAYTDVPDWPDTIPQDITEEEVNRVFTNAEFQNWMIEDMSWLKGEIFIKEHVRTFLDKEPRLIALLSNGSGLGTSLSRFAQAITDFARDWR